MAIIQPDIKQPIHQMRTARCNTGAPNWVQKPAMLNKHVTRLVMDTIRRINHRLSTTNRWHTSYMPTSERIRLVLWEAGVSPEDLTDKDVYQRWLRRLLPRPAAESLIEHEESIQLASPEKWPVVRSGLLLEELLVGNLVTAVQAAVEYEREGRLRSHADTREFLARLERIGFEAEESRRRELERQKEMGTGRRVWEWMKRNAAAVDACR